MVTTRQQEAQRFLRTKGRLTAEVECLNCGTVHTVDRTEDGGEVDQQPCHDDDCPVMLCGCCPQFRCDGCGLLHCVEHRVRYSDLELCRICMRGISGWEE